MILCIKTFGIMTLSIMALSITTFGIMTLSIKTFSIGDIMHIDTA
jgi:hypothetical protein